MTTRTIALVVLLALAGGAAGHDFAASGLRVLHPWAEPAPEAGGRASVYLEVHNDGKTDDTLVSASTTPGISRSVLLQRSSGDGKGWDSLPAGVDVAAGEALRFEADALRIALDAIGVPLTEGTRFPLFLTFRNAGTVEVEVWVEGRKSHDGHGH